MATAPVHRSDLSRGDVQAGWLWCVYWNINDEPLRVSFVNLIVLIIIGFSYQEAPHTLKSIVSALWLLNAAFGNLITLVLVSSLHIFNYQSQEFLFFAGLMFVDTLIFGILAYFYKSSACTKKVQVE